MVCLPPTDLVSKLGPPIDSDDVGGTSAGAENEETYRTRPPMGLLNKKKVETIGCLAPAAAMQ